MNNILYFEKVYGINNLYLEHIFLEFENEPILFTCIDENKQLYLCLCSEIREEQRWIISKSDINTVQKLVVNEIDILTALCTPETLTVVVRDIEGNENSHVEKTEQMDPLELPEAGTMLCCDKERTMNYMTNKKFEMLSFELEKVIKSSNACKTQDKSYNTVFESMVNILNDRLETYISCEYKTTLGQFEEKKQTYNIKNQEVTSGLSEKTDSDSLSAA